ncbi:MAG: hypothetical protein WA966_09975 [Ornithinimicrobium sp.]
MTQGRCRGPVLSALLGSAVSTALAQRLTDHSRGEHRRWLRENHAGRSVTLLEGVWCVCGTTSTLTWLDPAGAVIALGAGLTGAYDDLHPDAERKGLKGHLSALLRGEVSPGALKIVGLLGTGVIGALCAGRRPPLEVALDASVVAASANMMNLLDLRPGRALKVAVAVAVPLLLPPLLSAGACDVAKGAGAAAALGAAAVLLPEDLAGRTMLGDTGANSLGALLGHAATQGSRGRRVALLAALAAGTLLSERVSFSAVIDANPVLRALDHWGRTSG